MRKAILLTINVQFSAGAVGKSSDESHLIGSYFKKLKLFILNYRLVETVSSATHGFIRHNQQDGVYVEPEGAAGTETGQEQVSMLGACYLGHPEAVEILQKFEGVVELALGQMLCHHRPPDGDTNTSPRRSQLHTNTQTCNFIPVKQRFRKIHKYVDDFSPHLPDALIQSVRALSDPRWVISRGVFLVGSSRDVGMASIDGSSAE